MLGAAIDTPPAAAAGVDLESVFRRHHAMVFRAAWRVTGNAGDAEDVLQTVFLRLLKRDPEAATVGNLEGYLRRAAINAAVDLMRSRQVARAVPLEDLAPRLEDPSPAPDRALNAGEVRDWLKGAIARLNPRAAEMLALRFFEGKGNHEIAEMLGTTPSTVAVTLHRTRERINKEFQEYMGELA